MSKIIKSSKVINNIIRSSDNRGDINSISDHLINNVSIITSYKNTIRSNHYHKKNFHIIHVLSGSIHYFYKSININSKIKYFFVGENESVFTPNNEWHCTFFPIKTKMIVCSSASRDQKSYEKDTVRENLIDKNNIKEYLKKFI